MQSSRSQLYKESDTYVELSTLSKDQNFNLDSYKYESIGLIKNENQYKINLTKSINYTSIIPTAFIIYTSDDKPPKEITSINLIINGNTIIRAPYAVLYNYGTCIKTPDAYILRINYSMFMEYIPIKAIAPIKNTLSISVCKLSNVTNIQLVYKGIKYDEQKLYKIINYGDNYPIQTCETNTIIRSTPTIYIKQQLSINHISKGLFIECNAAKLIEIAINLNDYEYLRYNGPTISAVCNVYSDSFLFLPFATNDESKIISTQMATYTGGLLSTKYKTIEIELLFSVPMTTIIIHSLCFNSFVYKHQTATVYYKFKTDRTNTHLIDDPLCNSPIGNNCWV